MTKVTAGTVKIGTTIAGISGDFPSATYPLSGATSTPDLLNFITQLTSEGNFEYWDSVGLRRTGSGDIDISSATVKLGSEFENLNIIGSIVPENYYNQNSHDEFSCRLNSAGQAYCWGYNRDGRFGIGSPSGAYSTPVPVNGGHNFSFLSAVDTHVCGITATNQTYCWGKGSLGELGNGSFSQQNAPVLVGGGHDFTSLYLNIEYTCGITTSNQAYCWGYNRDGRFGIGSPSGSYSTPVAVNGGHNFTFLSTSSTHVCGITTTNQTYCWGKNTNGQLGNGNYIQQNAPVLAYP